MTTKPNTTAGYPPLPDFETVEQHVYGACRRYLSQDMLEPIYNLMRDYVDADRPMRAQAAPEYSEAMGVAGQAYFELVGKHAHPLPAMWRWSEVYEAMLAAAPSAPVAPNPAEGVPAQGDAELLAEAKSEGYESSLAYVQALKQHVATYRAERNSAREAHRRVRAEGDDAKDAQRYRCLRDKNNSLETRQRDTGAINGTSCYHDVGGVRELKYGAELDAAIDAFKPRRARHDPRSNHSDGKRGWYRAERRANA